jgi:translation initiation factor 5
MLLSSSQDLLLVCTLSSLFWLLLLIFIDVIKYFGFELGAQTNTNPADDRWIINGAHEASKLQDYLDGFINKFVLCRKCKNPETVVNIKNDNITLDCKACGVISNVDARLKLCSFILKNEPKKGKKKDKGDKAARRAAKQRRANGGGDDDSADDNDNGSPPGSNSDGADDYEDEGVAAGSDDELTRRIKEGAADLEDKEVKDDEWHVDVSEEAVRARAAALTDDVKRTVLVDDDEDGEGAGGSSYDDLATWIEAQAKEKGGISKVSDVDIYVKAKELGIESKHRTVQVLACVIFDEQIVKQIPARAGMLKKMITSDRHEKAFLGGTERFVGVEKPALISQVPAILAKYYEHDLLSEDAIKKWGSKASKRYVDLATSKKVRKSAEPFMEWLENAESDEEESDEE